MNEYEKQLRGYIATLEQSHREIMHPLYKRLADIVSMRIDPIWVITPDQPEQEGRPHG